MWAMLHGRWGFSGKEWATLGPPGSSPSGPRCRTARFAFLCSALPGGCELVGRCSWRLHWAAAVCVPDLSQQLRAILAVPGCRAMAVTKHRAWIYKCSKDDLSTWALLLKQRQTLTCVKKPQLALFHFTSLLCKVGEWIWGHMISRAIRKHSAYIF